MKGQKGRRRERRSKKKPREIVTKQGEKNFRDEEEPIHMEGGRLHHLEKTSSRLNCAKLTPYTTAGTIGGLKERMEKER